MMMVVVVVAVASNVLGDASEGKSKLIRKRLQKEKDSAGSDRKCRLWSNLTHKRPINEGATEINGHIPCLIPNDTGATLVV